MKRIGIMTWYGVRCGGFNFGTCLQSAALLRVLRDIGYDARMLDFKSINLRRICKSLVYTMGLLRISRAVVNFLALRSVVDGDYECRLYKWNQRNYREFHVGHPLLLRWWIRKMYCLVSGSDQIWNTYHRFNPKMFLDFGRDVKRVSYASSIGTHDVNPVYEYEMRCLLKPYRHISLRENAGVVAVSRLTGRDDIRRVQDPTLLMDCDDWRRIAGQESLHQEGLPKRFLLCYLLSENSEYQKQLRDVSNRLSIRDIIIIPSLECPNFSFDGATRYVHATPSEFVQLIDKAVYVCTDSFHATVLSMILSKQFVEFIRFSDGDKTSQNTRIYELLNRYGLDSRIYCAENYRWSDIIEYGPILRKLAEDRAESLSYLKHIIAE